MATNKPQRDGKNSSSDEEIRKELHEVERSEGQLRRQIQSRFPSRDDERQDIEDALDNEGKDVLRDLRERLSTVMATKASPSTAAFRYMRLMPQVMHHTNPLSSRTYKSSPERRSAMS